MTYRRRSKECNAHHLGLFGHQVPGEYVGVTSTTDNLGKKKNRIEELSLGLPTWTMDTKRKTRLPHLENAAVYPVEVNS
jgi:hypothetical protein